MFAQNYAVDLHGSQKAVLKYNRQIFTPPGLPKHRGKKAMLCKIIFVIVLSIGPLLEIDLSNFGDLVTHGLLFLVLEALTIRICFLAEEWQHLIGRYGNKYSDLFTKNGFDKTSFIFFACSWAFIIYMSQILRRCSVPGCSSNYNTENRYTTVFNFAKILI